MKKGKRINTEKKMRLFWDFFNVRSQLFVHLAKLKKLNTVPDELRNIF